MQVYTKSGDFVSFSPPPPDVITACGHTNPASESLDTFAVLKIKNELLEFVIGMPKMVSTQSMAYFA